MPDPIPAGAGIDRPQDIAAHLICREERHHGAHGPNTLGVTSVLEVDPVFVGTQIGSNLRRHRPDAVKIGMVAQ